MAITPVSYHAGDKQWIAEQLAKLPLVKQYQAAEGYSNLHQKALDKYAGRIDCDSMARRIANTRLREFIAAHRAK